MPPYLTTIPLIRNGMTISISWVKKSNKEQTDFVCRYNGLSRCF